jgi:hypothetical protein
MACLCRLCIPSKASRWRDQHLNIVRESTDLPFTLMITLLGMELLAAQSDFAGSCQVGLAGIRQIQSHRDASIPVIVAVLFDRLAGITPQPNHSILYMAVAEEGYERVEHHGHALRCLIWLFRGLPQASWGFIRQWVWFKKSKLLVSIGQADRALENFRQLIALSDLHPDLHEPIIADFRTTLGRNTLSIAPLLEVRRVTLIDPTLPEFWGLDSSHFTTLIAHFEDSMSNSSLSFEVLWAKPIERKVRECVVQTGSEVIVVVSIHNRYRFPLDVQNAKLEASKNKGSCTCLALPRQEVLGTTCWRFRFVAQKFN